MNPDRDPIAEALEELRKREEADVRRRVRELEADVEKLGAVGLEFVFVQPIDTTLPREELIARLIDGTPMGRMSHHASPVKGKPSKESLILFRMGDARGGTIGKLIDRLKQAGYRSADLDEALAGMLDNPTLYPDDAEVFALSSRYQEQGADVCHTIIGAKLRNGRRFLDGEPEDFSLARPENMFVPLIKL